MPISQACFAGGKRARHASPLRDIYGVIFVHSPFAGIFRDIPPALRQLFIISDDVLVEVALPDSGTGVVASFIHLFRDGRFKRSDNGTDRSS